MELKILYHTFCDFDPNKSFCFAREAKRLPYKKVREKYTYFHRLKLQNDTKISKIPLTSALLCAKVFLFPMKVSEVAMSQPILEVVPENLVRVPKVQGDHIAESLRQKDGADI